MTVTALLRATLAVALSVCGIAAVLAVTSGSWWLAWAVPVALVATQASVLAIEFTWLHRHHGLARGPSAASLLRAWSVEVARALLTFGWRQPFRRAAIPDRFPDGPPTGRGVVFVHGFFCNRAVWTDWLRDFARSGVPFVAVDLPAPFAPIESHCDTIAAAVRTVTAAAGGRPPVVVAHSMGGLAVRAWLARERAGDGEQVHRLVTIGTPHRGTLVARFARSANGRQMRIGSRFLDELDRAEPPDVRSRFTCFWSDCDNVVFPSMNATLPGADNRAVRGRAHVDLLAHPAIRAHVLEALGPRQMS